MIVPCHIWVSQYIHGIVDAQEKQNRYVEKSNPLCVITGIYNTLPTSCAEFYRQDDHLFVRYEAIASLSFI